MSKLPVIYELPHRVELLTIETSGVNFDAFVEKVKKLFPEGEKPDKLSFHCIVTGRNIAIKDSQVVLCH